MTFSGHARVLGSVRNSISVWLKTVAAASVAAVMMLMLSAGFSPCLAQQSGAMSTGQGYASQDAGAYSQSASASSGQQGGDNGASVPIPGGGQVNVPQPGSQTSETASGSRGGVWSLQQTNPDSVGGLPSTGP